MKYATFRYDTAEVENGFYALTTDLVSSRASQIKGSYMCSIISGVNYTRKFLDSTRTCIRRNWIGALLDMSQLRIENLMNGKFSLKQQQKEVIVTYLQE